MVAAAEAMMGVALRNPRYFSTEEYLSYEQQVGERQEYVNGVIYAMVGGTDRHNLIAGNIYFALRGQLPATCQVFQQGMKVRIRTDIGEAQYYPDVFASCTEADRETLFRESPCMIVAVLSPSTESDDRQGKFALYRTIPMLEQYILVAQDVPQVEVFARGKAWKPDILFRGDKIDVCGGRAQLTVDGIYEGITF
ncbi:MAG: Uma2 family endonuclease [Hyphomicrobiaceae bacterium]|nr:Uma2 family endonuclease [Hyphomicrobiaceae bacterium]